jgi:hypothetical protein
VNLCRNIGTHRAQVSRKQAKILAHTWKGVSHRAAQDSQEGARRFSCCGGMCSGKLELAPFTKVEVLPHAWHQKCQSTHLRATRSDASIPAAPNANGEI